MIQQFNYYSFTYLPVHVFIHPNFNQSIHPSSSQSVNGSKHLFFHLSVEISVHLNNHQAASTPIHPHINQCI